MSAASTSENQALIDALREAGKVRVEHVSSGDGVVAPIAITDGGKAFSIKSLVEEWRDRPALFFGTDAGAREEE